MSFTCNGQRYIASYGFFEDGRLAEIFIQNSKPGSHSDVSSKDAAILASLGLQYGIPLHAIRRSLLRDGKGNAASPIGCVLDLISATRNDAP
jgi:hypothetical protein